MDAVLRSLPGTPTREGRPDDPVYATSHLILPQWYIDLLARRRREIQRMVVEDRLKNDPGYQEEQERKKKDTKPLFYQDTSERHRPVIIVGGGGMWYQDLKEKALRLKERPNPAQDYSSGLHDRNVREDLWVAVDRRKRVVRGTRTFHIRNNPVAREA